MEDSFSTLDWSTPLDLVDFMGEMECTSRRSTSCWNEISVIAPGLLLCGEAVASDRFTLQAMGVALVLTMNGEAHIPPFRAYSYNAAREKMLVAPLTADEFCRALCDECTSISGLPTEHRTILYRSVTAEDSPCFDMSTYFVEMCNLIEVVSSRRRAQQIQQDPSRPSQVALPAVLVHCLAGVSRSTTIVLAYLMKRTHSPQQTVLDLVAARRPIVCPNNGFANQLNVWHLCRYNRAADVASSRVVAREVAQLSRTEQLKSMQSLVEVIVRHNSMRVERKVIGSLIRFLVELQPENEVFHVLVGIRSMLTKIACNLLQDEEQVDAPCILHTWVEVADSCLRAVPSLHFAAEDSLSPFVLSDKLMLEPLTALFASPGDKAYVAEAVGKWLSAIVVTGMPMSLLASSGQSPMEPTILFSFSDNFKTSFPVLASLSKGCEVFVPCSKLAESSSFVEVYPLLLQYFLRVNNNLYGSVMSPQAATNPDRFSCCTNPLRWVGMEVECTFFLQLLASFESGVLQQEAHIFVETTVQIVSSSLPTSELVANALLHVVCMKFLSAIYAHVGIMRIASQRVQSEKVDSSSLQIDDKVRDVLLRALDLVLATFSAPAGLEDIDERLSWDLATWSLSPLRRASKIIYFFYVVL